MPRRLILAPRARDDIEAARRWLMQHGSGSAAWHKLDAILAAIEDLRDHPCRFPFGFHPGVRERLCAGGWRALYQVRPDTGRDETAGDVRVLRVYGPSQDRRGFRLPP
ncbi:MAG: type II toxin-antitoxin system RelE/ParE family toxin [Acetobacteraceae bacterium]